MWETILLLIFRQFGSTHDMSRFKFYTQHGDNNKLKGQSNWRFMLASKGYNCNSLHVGIQIIYVNLNGGICGLNKHKCNALIQDGTHYFRIKCLIQDRRFHLITWSF